MMRSAIAFYLGVVVLVAPACSSSSGGASDGGSGDSGAHAVVPADMRDVEREGEGLVSTSFGTYPMRTPDWNNAASVLSLLKQVWGRAKSASPGLPQKQVKMIDDAIATLDQGIPAKDQQKAAYAANQVGLACPELFAYYDPSSPLEVLRMDAQFRQVGLDAHFKMLPAVATDVSDVKTAWSTLKGKVASTVPTCQRVGGTATVSGDIDQSLANLTTALTTGDATTMEKESDNGALEVDTLELLFDCPPGIPGSSQPGHGTGATCTSSTTANCDPGQVCDTAWSATGSSGKCAPDPSNKIGTTCMVTTDCGTDPRSACNNASGDNYPGGYCIMEPCDDVQVCPPGATCVSLGGEKPSCFKTCATDSDCRTSDGYVCQLFSTTPPVGFGPSAHACAFPCMRDTDCQMPLKCDLTTHKCTP